MTSGVDTSPSQRSPGWVLWQRMRLHATDGVVIACSVFVVLLLVNNQYTPIFNSLQFLLISNGTAVLALAAIGETLVVLTRGFDLSVGGVLALVNVTLAQHLNGDLGHDILLGLAGLGIGAASGFVNGFFTAVMGVQPIVVTLATLFVLSGLAIAVMAEPGGSVPSGYTAVMTGGDPIPHSFLFVLGAAAIWLVLVRTRFGKAMYAIGSDPVAAHLSGVPVRRVLLLTYTLAGTFYGAAGIYLTGQIASGDPLIGTSFLLAAFVAVVLGGVRFGGGYGTAIGSIVGAFTVTIIGNLLVAAGLISYYTTIVEGVVLMIAVLLGVAAQRVRVQRPVRFRAIGRDAR